MFVLIMIIHWFKKDIASMIKKKFIDSRKPKELNEEHIMKEIDVNFHEDGLVEEIDVVDNMTSSEISEEI